MATKKVKCPYCGSEEVVRYGRNRKTGRERFPCKNPECGHRTFQLGYKNNACKTGMREKIVELVMNGLDTRRMLGVSKDTVTKVLKTEEFAKPVSEAYLKELEEQKAKEENQTVDVVICNALAAEMDEMWSFYHDKSHQVWLWWAVDHATNTPLAYVFGTRGHKYLEELLKLLEPFSIGTVYADNHFSYSNKIANNQLVTGKKNTQRMERDHLTLCARIKRLARKTICFSKSKQIHMAVIETFVNLFFFYSPFDVSILL